MINKILIGSDEGAYTVTNGARTITLTGLSFVPTQEQLAYVYNKTQDKLYYAPAQGLAKATLSGGVITIDSTFAVLATADILHIQMWLPERAYDTGLDSGKVIVQNPEYAHTTSVETLIDESALAGQTATADVAGGATILVDADGAFSIATTAVGYSARNITESTSALVSSVDSTSQITTGAGITSWSGDVYRLPAVRRYEINMDTYRNLSIHYRLTNGASLNTYLKIYGTLDAAANVDSDSNWVDMSTAILGAAAGINVGASASAEAFVNVASPVPMLKFMLKLVVECTISTAPTNTYRVFIKKA